MDKFKQVVSFRGTVADEIAKNLLPSTGGVNLGNALLNYIREHSDDLACRMEDDKIVIAQKNDY